MVYNAYRAYIIEWYCSVYYLVLADVAVCLGAEIQCQIMRQQDYCLVWECGIYQVCCLVYSVVSVEILYFYCNVSCC